MNMIDPTGMFSLGSVVTTVGILGSLTTIGNITTSIIAGIFIASDDDGLPDAAIMTVNLYGGTRGFGAEVGFDLILDFSTWKLYAFVYGSIGFTPLSYFENFRGQTGLSVAAGVIYNMNSIDEWSGGSVCATWPLSIIHLLPKAMFSKWKMWGALTQLAKQEHNLRTNDMVLQADISNSGPAAIKIGMSSNTFSWQGGLTSRPIDLQEVGESLGELLAPIYLKVLEMEKLRNNPELAITLVE
jgi:hypothetical protein